ncbi:unnamed protein product [Darwinula stevensoni]|uniref:Phosphotransferase n=1 Tax=Darwinula stevensoni TaxID=69355 RepID=A0A7R9AE76_9CRUS|nr:unnamed protein product [Darwinula stevensoni]CAG0901734.1 unnamed protein product [Darwinula stevensoni]
MNPTESTAKSTSPLEDTNQQRLPMGSCPFAISDPVQQAQVEEILKPLILTQDVIDRVRDVFEDEMKLGLAKNPPKLSSLQMENTFLPELPNGTESGEYLALDLGGTNFRVILMELKEGTIQREEVKYYKVPEEVRLGPGEQLFDFLADCIKDFLEKKHYTGEKLTLGFCFSFPMHQKALNVGILVHWTKSFNCPGVVGKDAVKMLNDAIHRRCGHAIDVVAVLNDTTGTIVKGAYVDHETAIGLILGTGSNACYLERVSRIEKWEGQHDAEEVVIDIEFGAFGDNGVLDFMKTDFDREINRNSLLVGSFTYEKYFAGKYLGEIARLILVKLVDEELLFKGKCTEKLRTVGSFTSQYVSHIEKDSMELSTEETEKILGEFGLSYTQDDLKIIKYVCAVISERAANLVSICLAHLLCRMDKPHCTIAVDGSLFEEHPRLRTLMEAKISAWAPGKQFKFLMVEDGSGKGAALIAAIATRLRAHSKAIISGEC